MHTKERHGMTEYNDNFMEEFTAIWERFTHRLETSKTNGKWETIDRYVANDTNRVYMRVNRELGLFMPELIMGTVTESDVRDNEGDAVLLYNAYIAKAFSRSQAQKQMSKERRDRKRRENNGK